MAVWSKRAPQRHARESSTLSPELKKVLGTGTGVLASQHIEALIRAGAITADAPVEPAQVQPASLDLRLGAVAYRVRAGFLPGAGGRVEEKLRRLVHYDVDLRRGAHLDVGHVYVIPLKERLRLPAGVRAKANPKSTTGRLDIFTRLVTDGGAGYEDVEEGYEGPLYVEVMPLNFNVKLREGTSLNQIRFVKGAPHAGGEDLRRAHRADPLVFQDDEVAERLGLKESALLLTVDLLGRDTANVVGYKARKNAPVIDLDAVGAHEILDFWEPIRRTDPPGLILHPGDFYILGSCESVSIPPTYAASMVEYSPEVGEFRAHYAGFFDPGFGYGRSETRGTRAVLEVRCHDVPFLLEHGQVVCSLKYDRLIAKPAKLYGSGIGSSYQQQGLALSKQFKRPG